MKIARNLYKFMISATLTAAVFANSFLTDIILPGSGVCYATEQDYMEEWEQRKTLPIQSNDIENWPDGPAIGAQAAILMEMDTHTILYAKNIHEKCYPASTTKILTCLLAMQNCTMDETVTFSHDAIFDVPYDGSKVGGLNEGDSMLMEQALYCVLVKSGNEVATAVGEHVAGKLGREQNAASFAQIMNEEAEQLGCKNTHFVNCNGLYDDNHYTTAYDLALIGCEFFSNDLLCKMSSTPSYHFKLNPDDEDYIWITSKNLLYKGKDYEYEYLLGSKTGYVTKSRQTLVSAAEKNGMKLVCVVFTEESPYQFEDTITLFQYGFENFQKLSINENETKYKVNTMDLFDTENDLFGDSTPLITIENDTYVVLPNTAEFADTTSTLTYNNEKDSNILATINYKYSDIDIGCCNIVFSKTKANTYYDFAVNLAAAGPVGIFLGSEKEEQPVSDGAKTENENDINVIFINIKTLLIAISMVAAAIVLIIIIASIINSYNFSPKGQSNRRRRERRRESRARRSSTRRYTWHQKRSLRRRWKRR